MSSTMRVALAVLSLAMSTSAWAIPGPERSIAGDRPGAVVAGVVLNLPEGEEAGPLRSRIAVREGSPLSPRALRQTVEALYATRRFSNVRARIRSAEGAPGRIVVVLECIRRRSLDSVRVIDGSASPALDEKAIRRAVGLAAGDELWEGRVQRAVAQLRSTYSRRGYREADVHASLDGASAVTVTLRIDQGPPTIVETFRLGVGSDLGGALASGLATQPGAVLDLEALDQDVKRIRGRLRDGGYLRARVGTPSVSVQDRSARIELEVDPGPRIDFQFEGNHAFRDEELRGRLGVEAEQALDEQAIQASAGRLRAFYLSQGFASVRVNGAEIRSATGSTVLFRIDEGIDYVTRSVRFPGVTQRGEEWLLARLGEALETVAPIPVTNPAVDAALMAEAIGSPLSTTPRKPADPRRVWNSALWDEGVARLMELYRAEGYLDAAHEGTKVTLDSWNGTADVEIRIKEGPLTRVAEVSFEGNAAVPTSELAPASRLSVGEPLAFAGVEATRAAVLALYARRGHAYARVVETEEFSPDRTSAKVRFRVTEGPKVEVRKILVTGARRTREYVIREAVTLREGDTYDPEAVSESQAALLRLGVFRSVGMKLSEPEVPAAEKDLQIDLSERPWRTLAPGIGFSLANGPRAFVELIKPNVLGRALELSARAKVNYPLAFDFRSDAADLEKKSFFERVEGRAELGLRDPRVHLLGMKLGGRVGALVERVHRRAYDMSRGAVSFALDHPATRNVALSLQYEVETDYIEKSPTLAGFLTFADVERRRFPDGFTVLNALRPVVTIDHRDNPLNPRRGWYATLMAEYAHSIGGSSEEFLFGIVKGSSVHVHMLKVTSGVTGYLPLDAGVVFALSLRGGQVFPMDEESKTIGPKRFFLGGASSMRGYGEDELIPEDLRDAYIEQVRACAGSLSGLACSQAAQLLRQGQTLISEGGEAFAMVKAEVRLPIRSSVDLGLFVDAGNLWSEPRNANLRKLRYSAGVGLRFATPVGPAVFDVGFALTPDSRLGEKQVAPHFSIGVF